MPTKFTFHKWLCDACALLCDTELECHVHERDAHKQDELKIQLEQIFTRIDCEQSVEVLADYERLCHSILLRLIENKSTKNMNMQMMGRRETGAKICAERRQEDEEPVTQCTQSNSTTDQIMDDSNCHKSISNATEDQMSRSPSVDGREILEIANHFDELKQGV